MVTVALVCPDAGVTTCPGQAPDSDGTWSTPQTNCLGVSPAAAVMVKETDDPAAGSPLKLALTVGALGAVGSTMKWHCDDQADSGPYPAGAPSSPCTCQSTSLPLARPVKNEFGMTAEAVLPL